MKEETLSGIFKKATWAQGSKSEHEAIVLHTDDNRKLLVRLNGSNPFDYSHLKPFVDKKVSVTGKDAGYNVFRIDSVSRIQL